MPNPCCSLLASFASFCSHPLIALCLCLHVAFFIATASVLAQAPGYSREEVAIREGEQLTEGITKRDDAVGMVGQDMLSSGAQSIGSARSGVRSRGDGQSAMLRYDQHREVQPPPYALVRIGPWYSNLGISQSVGYRYMKLEGSGVDFLTGGDRGQILEDGSDFPLVTTLSLDNYVILSRRMDLEANIKVSYEHFPMKTQEDRLEIDLTDEGVYGTFSSEFHPSRDTRLLIYDDILYRTDYVDTRGYSDTYGGEEYEHFANVVGADWDWKPSPFDNVSLSASRTDEIPLDDEFDDQKRVGYSEVAAYQRQLTPFATAGLVGSFSQSFYDEDTRPDIYLYGLSAFSAAQLTRSLTGNASLGYQFSSYSGGGADREGQGSLSARVGLGHQLSEQRSQRVGYQRTQSEAFTGGIDIRDELDYGLSWEGGLFPGSLTTRYSMYSPQDDDRSGYSDWMTALSLRNQLTRLIMLNFRTGYSIRMNDAPVGEIDPETPDINSDYETFTIRLGAGMRITRKTVFNAYVEHADRTSDNDDLAYTRDIIAATLTWSHQF